MAPMAVSTTSTTAASGVVIWYLDVRHLWRSEKEFAMALNLLPEQSRAKIGNLLYEEDARMALASQLLQRYVVSLYTKVPWSQVRIATTPNGRPFIPHAKFDFNVSHQSGIVAIAVTVGNDARVGIDITDCNLDNADAYISAVSQLFSKTEMSIIEESLYPSRLMFHYWCLKEATVKMTGSGITDEFASLQVSNVTILEDPIREGLVQTPSLPMLYVNGHLQRDWHATNFMLDNNLVGAVVTNGPPNSPVVLKKLSLHELSESWRY